MSSAAPAEVAEPRGLGSETSPATAAAGPGSDWQEIYAANVASVYRFVYSKTGNRPDAEDVTSQVFLRAMPYLRPATPEETRAYLFATARTQLANHWRARCGTGADTMDVFAATPAEEPHSDAARRRIDCLLGHLPERYRRVLELRFLRGFSIAETATELHISAGNARVTQLRALRRAAELGAAAPCSQS